MGLRKYIGSQLRKPSGFFGRHLTSRYLNWINKDLNRQTLASLSLTPGDTVLEVGFGAGDLISRIAAVLVDGSIAGVDFSPEMVDVCTKRFGPLIAAGRLELRCASAESLPYAADHFTRVCTVNTVYFWADPARCMRELRRVLRAGGRLVVGFVPRSTVGNGSATQYGLTLYDADEMRRVLERAGFRDVEIISGTDRRGEFICAVGTK
jgi:arsenite methyltransferase